jgi:hypothetical protein
MLPLLKVQSTIETT